MGTNVVDAEVRKKLPADAIVFDNQSYDKSIIGVTFDGRAIYCLEWMVNELAEEWQCEFIDAYEWIEYNTIRSIPLISGKAPVIVSMGCIEL